MIWNISAMFFISEFSKKGTLLTVSSTPHILVKKSSFVASALLEDGVDQQSVTWNMNRSLCGSSCILKYRLAP